MDDPVLDCNGHRILGDDWNIYGHGIDLNDSSDNNVVMNCEINGFYNGILIIQSYL